MNDETEGQHLRKITDAIKKGKGITFKYLRPDAQVTSHNAVYPREILRKGDHIFFKAYCHFTHDVRLFSLDRVQLLRLTQSASSKRPPALKERLVTVFIILGSLASYTIWTFTGGNPKGEWVLVTHVTDGDTIGVGRGWRYEKVRFIGVDTPETVHPTKPIESFGPESSAFTKKQLLGKKVHLEFESGRQYGDYGRLLAYVFLSNGTFFNAELVKHGYARVFGRDHFQYYKEFRRYEREARKGRVGIWNTQ